MGNRCRTPSRWFGVSKKPDAPGVEALRYVSGENHSALPAELMICWSIILDSARRLGSTWPCSCRRRSPQIETLDTPLTPDNRGTIVHRASTDISMADIDSDDSPTFFTRLADETEFKITGGLPTFGNA